MNNLRLTETRPTDYQRGDGNIPFKGIINSGNWIGHIEYFETQKLPDGAETSGCEFFTQQESFDAQMDLLFPTFSDTLQTTLYALGYMDKGLDGKLHFHSSPRFLQILSGVGTAGTSMTNVWDLCRTYGMLPFTDLPSDSNLTIQQYLDPISVTPAMTQKAQQFLAVIGGKNAIKYNWLWQDKPKDVVALATALRQAPVCLGVAVTGGWNQVTPQDPPAGQAPQHAVMAYAMVGETVSILDHYEPFEKILDAGYEISYALQGIVNPIVNVIVNQPVPLIQQHQVFSPTIAPTQQNVNLLTQIVALYQKILSLLSPQPKGIPELQKVAPEEIYTNFMQKVFANSHAFWNWLVTSSSDPTQLALTAKGLMSLGTVQAIFAMLPMIGIHPSFDLNGLGDQIYTVVYAGASAISAIAIFVGGAEKIYRTLTGTIVAKPPQV